MTGAALAWLHWGTPALAFLTLIATALCLTALFWPKAYAPVSRLLDGLLHALLSGLSWFMMALVFMLIFVPGKLLLIIRNKHGIERKLDASSSSYWQKVPKACQSRERFLTQF